MVTLLGGVGGVLLTRGPSPEVVAAEARAERLKSMDRRFRSTKGHLVELGSGADFASLSSARSELLSLSEEAAGLGQGELALEAEALAQSRDLEARVARAQATLLRETQEGLERTRDRDRAARLLEALPVAFRLAEQSWYRGQAERLEAWRGLEIEVARFLKREGPSRLADLRESRQLLVRATQADLRGSREAAEVVDWTRRQRGLSLTVLREEVTLRGDGKQSDGEHARRLLESLEPELSAFFARHPRETSRLLAVLPPSEARGFMNAYVGASLWEEFRLEDWFPVLERSRPQDRPLLFGMVPPRKWSEVPPRRLCQGLREVPTPERVRCVLALPAACLRRLSVTQLRTLLKDWPGRFRALVTRLLPQDFQTALGARAGDPSGTSIGTGFYITPHLLLTNAHVVGKATRVRLEGADQVADGRVLACSESEDLALIRTDRKGPPLTPARSAHLRSVLAYGHGSLAGSSQTLLATSGRVAGSSPEHGRLIFSGHVNPGNSGGPLVDSEGHWVGVVMAKCVRGGDEEPMAIAIQAERALEWLQSHGVRLKTRGPSRSDDPPHDAGIRPSVVRIVSIPLPTEEAEGANQALGEPQPKGAATPRHALRLYLRVLSRIADVETLDRILDYPAIVADLKRRNPNTRLTPAQLAASFRSELSEPPTRVLSRAEIEGLLRVAKVEGEGSVATLTLPGALEYRLRRGPEGWKIVYFPH